MQPTSARPMGITILAVLAAIGGVFGLLGSLAFLAIGGLAATAGAGVLGGMGMVFGLLLAALAIVELAFAYGAWTLKPWAWMLGIVAQGISIAIALVDGATGGTINFVGIAISAVIIYYLMTPAVKQAFGRA